MARNQPRQINFDCRMKVLKINEKLSLKYLRKFVCIHKFDIFYIYI